MKSNRFAVIDIGTLKVKFLVAEFYSDGTYQEIYKSNTLTCFGCEMQENGGLITDKNLNDTIIELNRCKQIIQELKVDDFRVVSTHAMRKANNREEVIQKIKAQTGFRVDNISQDQEAELFFNAVLRDFPKNNKYAIADIGGGSVQILIGTPDHLIEKYLLPIGAQYLHETFTSNPHNELSVTTTADIDRIKDHIVSQLLPIATTQNTPLIYGSTNIIDLCKAIGIKLDQHADSTAHPYQTYATYFDEFVNKVLALTYKTREEKYPFQYGYMWGIDKAFTVITQISKHLNSPYIIPSNANISQAILYSMWR